MRVRQFELRILAVALTLFWALGALIVLATYHPGGPVDLLVGLAACLPLPVAVVAIVWPPLVRSNRGSAGIFWLGLVAGLLLIPSLWALTQQIVQGDTRSQLPSAEVAYPFGLALFATSLFSGLGISRQFITEAGLGRRRIGASLGFAVATTLAIALSIAGVSLADTAALADQPPTVSRFGPTLASLVPPQCADPVVEPATAQVDLDFWGDVDGRAIGTASVAGVRSGQNASWKGQVAKGDLFGQYGTVMLGDSAWTLQVDGAWTSRYRTELGNALLDHTVLEQALSITNRATAEDRGFEYVEGARARRCRVAVDGPTFQETFPQMIWLSGTTNVKAWRGQLDYWIFGDGAVGRVEGFVNGASQTIVPHGLLATINVRMNILDRGRPVTITAPGS